MQIKELLIPETESIKDTLKKLDKTSEKVLLVSDSKDRLLGTITDGDVRRYILSNRSLDNDIREIYNKDPIYIKKEDFSVDLAKKILIENRIDLVPILNKDHIVIDFTTWNEVFSEKKTGPIRIGMKIDIPVVIMAGGKGSRLEPFTSILPKPLIPIGDKPIIEIIIDEFRKWGVKEYYLTLNHKAEMIEAYFTNGQRDYEIKYVKENVALGTIGSLKLLEDKVGDVFVVSNCDVIVKADFEEVINFHKEQKAVLTILSSIQHHKIPYGIIKFKEKGEITDIVEKPEYTFTINAGVYVFGKECLKFIPEGLVFDINDLVKSLIKNNQRVVMYPVNENDYIDIGQWEEYKVAIERLKIFT